MIKNSVKKLIIFAVCAIFVLPFVSLSAKKVGATELQKVFIGTDYTISLEDVSGFDGITSNEVKVEILYGSSNPIVLYENGSSKKADNYTAKYSNEKVTVTCFKLGTHKVIVSRANTVAKVEKSINVVDDYIELSYDFNQTKLNDFKEKVEKNGSNLYVGDSFEVPDVSSLISTNFSYDNIRKTVYYYTNGDSVSKSNYATSGKLKFSITNYGTYRFYVLFDIEKSNSNVDGGKSITVNGLKEKEDGFYRLSKGGENVYYDSKSGKCYKINDSAKGYDEEKEITGTFNETLMVPVFSFSVTAKAPKIIINSTYQEPGFIGLEYKLSSITITGDTIDETFELEYSSDDGKTWNKIDGLSGGATNLRFTPTEIGLYRVKVTAFSANAESSTGLTQNIVVSKAVESSKFKASFNDWFEVNKLPFILLCVSFVCLISIILILVINPKEKQKNVKEEDR